MWRAVGSLKCHAVTNFSLLMSLPKNRNRVLIKKLLYSGVIFAIAVLWGKAFLSS